MSVRLCRCLWLSAVIFYWSLRSVTARLIVLCRPRDGPCCIIWSLLFRFVIPGNLAIRCKGGKMRIRFDL